MTYVSIIDLPLLPLGRGQDLGAERGVECPGDLPAASDPTLVERARDRLYIAAILLDPDGEVRLHHRKVNDL